MKEDKIKIKINNRSYNNLSDIDIFITNKLKSELEGIKSERFGNLFSSLETNGFKGGKHLIETLKNKLGKFALILSHEKTELKNRIVIINYNDYRKSGNKAFFDVYRQTGLKTANNFLRENIPSIAPDISETVTKKDTEQVIETLPFIAKKVSDRKKNELFESISKLIRELKLDGKSITYESLNGLKASVNQVFYKNRLNEFIKRLGKNLPETKGKNSWQIWLYSNSWIFGSLYLKPISKKKVGFDQIPDYLFPTIDGFLDVLEIKTPKKDIIREDKNHNGSFYWSQDASEAIGQVINYLCQIEIHQLEIAKEIGIKTIKPRALILIGQTESWNVEKLEALRKLNFSLHGIEVLSYDQLLKRGERLIEIFNEDIKMKRGRSK